MIQCGRCGTVIPGGARFCGNCGAAIAPAPPVAPLALALATVDAGAAPARVVTTHTLTPAGGTFSAPGLELRVPAGAVAADTKLTLSALDSAPPSPDGNLVVVSQVFDLEAGPGVFAQEVEVVVPFDPAKLPPGKSDADLVGLLYGGPGRGYDRIPVASIDRAARKATLRLRHFSQPALGVLKEAARAFDDSKDLPFVVRVVDAHAGKQTPALARIVHETAAMDLRRALALPWQRRPLLERESGPSPQAVRHFMA